MKEKPEIDTILFDLDGTIIDTEPTAAKAVYDCFTDWGLKISEEDTAYVTGRTWASAFEYLFKKYRLPVSREEASQFMMKRYRQALEENLVVVPGSVQAVESLATHFPLGLVSGSRRAEILWALQKLEIHHHFKVILGAEDYPQSKPAPDGYQKAIHALQTRPHTCLVFEDSAAGIASARAAGLWVVAITGTNHFNQDVSNAHFHVSDLTQVNLEWIRSLGLSIQE